MHYSPAHCITSGDAMTPRLSPLRRKAVHFGQRVVAGRGAAGSVISHGAGSLGDVGRGGQQRGGLAAPPPGHEVIGLFMRHGQAAPATAVTPGIARRARDAKAAAARPTPPTPGGWPTCWASPSMP